jgi:hypothetical protein
MFGEAALGETVLGGETLDLGVPIIPEVAVPTRTLVFLVEIDLLKPGAD